MRLHLFERLGPWGIGALLLLLVHGLGPARSARASCGSLVTSNLERLRDFNQFDSLVVDGSFSSSVADPIQDAQGDATPEWPKPCSGPTCSSQDSSPASTTAPDPDRLDRWGDLNIRAFLSIPSRLHGIIDEPAIRLDGHRPAIFHPPQSRPDIFG